MKNVGAREWVKDERQTHILKLSPQSLDHLLPTPTSLIPRLKFPSLLICRVPPHRTDINHARPKLNKRPSHRRQPLKIGNVLEAELDEALVLLLAEPFDEGVGGNGTAEAKGGQAVFGKAEVEEGGDGDGGGAELFLLFDEVGASDLVRESKALV